MRCQMGFLCKCAPANVSSFVPPIASERPFPGVCCCMKSGMALDYKLTPGPRTWALDKLERFGQLGAFRVGQTIIQTPFPISRRFRRRSDGAVTRLGHPASMDRLAWFTSTCLANECVEKKSHVSEKKSIYAQSRIPSNVFRDVAQLCKFRLEYL